MLRFSQKFKLEKDAKYVIDKAFTALQLEKESGRTGYYFLPQYSLKTLTGVEEYAEKNYLLKSGSIKNIVLIGIGGSSLGIKAIDTLLSHKNKSGKKLFFLENSDPLNISKTLSKLKKEETLFTVISKSGSTIETISIFKAVIKHFKLDLNSEDKNRLISITDLGSPLSKFSSEYGIKQFNIPSNVGGRFSVLSTVGVVPLFLAGYDVKAILEGAAEFVKSFFEAKERHILEKAAYYAMNSETKMMNVLFSYGNELENLTKWYVQLWGESLGKISYEGKHVGLTPIGLIGAVDQHSFLQLLIEGPPNKTVTFININDFENSLAIPDISLRHIESTNFVNGKKFSELINAQCEATKESLEQSGVTVDSISFDKIHEGNIGKIIIYYELLTSLVGAMLHVNTYDQPGVELGKDLLYEHFKGQKN